MNSIAYQLSENEQRLLRLSNQDVEEARQRRAVAASLAASGKLWRLASKEAIAHADYLRMGKRIDPTLGIYGAYAYSLAGNEEGVASIYSWFAQKYFDRPEDIPIAPVLFDVAMLAGKVTPDVATDVPGFAPFCPIMTLGWSYVEASTRAHSLHDAILSASKYRLSAEWTSFDKKDVGPMIKAYERSEIL